MKKKIAPFENKKRVRNFLFVFFFFIIYSIILSILPSSYAFINVFSTQRLVNFSLVFDIVNDNSARGKLSVITNKIPRSNEFQYVYNNLKSKYKFTISNEARVIKKYFTLINLTAKMFDVPMLNYNDLKGSVNKSDEYVCFNNLCGEKYDVLNYIASNFSSDDAFEFVCKINHFVHEFITYDKSLVDDQNPTVTRILSVRRGVCVHYATLFNEMIKSIGLKSRIVYGMAKSSENDTQWDAHAWNEVYLGKWIPFDPTYDYCGLIDTLHIQLSHEPLKTTITFIGNGNVKFNDVINVSELWHSNNTFKFNLSYKIKFEYKKINFNSDQVAYVIVKNNENTYAFATLKIISTNRVKIPNDTKFIVLKPKETKVVEFLLKPEYYDQNYIYTIPVSVYDSWENTAMGSFVISKDGINFKYQKAEEPKSLNFSLMCNALNIYLSRDFGIEEKINCNVLNRGYSFVSDLKVYLNASNEFYLIENRSVLLSVNDSEQIISNSTKLINALKYLWFVKHKRNFSLIVEFKDKLYRYPINIQILNYSIVRKDDCFYLNLSNQHNKIQERVYIEWFTNAFHQNATQVCISEIKQRLNPIDDFNVTIRFKIFTSKYVAKKDIVVEVRLTPFEKIFNAIKAFFTWLFDFSGFEENLD